MAFTYDLATDTGKLRFLLGDTVQATALFQDEELAMLLALYSNSLYLSAAACCESLARRAATNANAVKIGDYQYSSESAAKHYLELAQRFRDAENDIPVFDVAEENLSGFNELAIIRNWVLRTDGGGF